MIRVHLLETMRVALFLPFWYRMGDLGKTKPFMEAN